MHVGAIERTRRRAADTKMLHPSKVKTYLSTYEGRDQVLRALDDKTLGKLVAEALAEDRRRFDERCDAVKPAGGAR